jgi:hypothetical protein
MNVSKATFLFEVAAGPDQAANTASLKDKIKLYPAIALGTHLPPDGKKLLTIVGSVPQNQPLLPKTAASGLPGVTFRRQR